MKNSIYKHKGKLKTKQPDFIAYLIKIFIGVIPVICYFFLKKVSIILNELDFQLIIPRYYLFISYLILTVNTFFVWFKSPLSFSKIQRMKYKLKHIIEANQFYYENKDLNKITLSMLIKFYWFENNLYLEVYPNGGKYTYKMNELTEIFQTSLNMTVISVQDDFANHTTYILSKETDNYIDSTNEWTV